MKCLPLTTPSDRPVLLAMLLMMSDAARAYITAPLERVCIRDEDLSNEFDLQPDSDFFRERSIVLEGAGDRSAALLSAKMSDPPCALVLEAPKDTHAITVSLNNFPEGSPCPLSLWYHDARDKNETWFLELCGREKRGLLALYPEVYPHRITLRWSARNDSRPTQAKQPLEIVVTAVARGPLCDEESRVLCWKMMKESLCISEELACDGRINCPRPGNEESESMCPHTPHGGLDTMKVKPSKAWDIVTDHLKRILAVKSGDYEVISSGERGRRVDVGPSVGKVDGGRGGVSKGEEEVRAGRGLSAIFGALPRLGPGSYALLAMLTCGSVLLLCGIWECCWRVRSQSTTISQGGSVVTRRSSGTTVVIISSTPPPQYEDLEQPPTYRDLFPARTKVTMF